MFLSTSGKRPLTSILFQGKSDRIEAKRTFPNRHGRNRTLYGILPFVAILAIEINAEFIVFTLPRSANAHGDRLESNVKMGKGKRTDGFAPYLANTTKRDWPAPELEAEALKSLTARALGIYVRLFST